MTTLKKNKERISKKQLKKIGDRIRNNTATNDDYAIISTLRGYYGPLTRALRDSLKNFKEVKELKNSNFIISRRIKRMPSIIKKLKRFPNMHLSRIQDLGGVRVILSDIHKVNILGTRLKNVTYKQKGKNNFLFIREKNYILEPKDDGYRSLHQIYRYQGKRYPDLTGLDIELQIRTVKQHQWATAVEILDMVLNTSLKLGIAEKQYKEFFKLCSYAIAYTENNFTIPIGYDNSYEIKNVLNRIKVLDEVYHIFSKLLSVSVITHNLKDIIKYKNISEEYLLLELDISKRRVRIKQSNNSEDIDVLYSYYENKYKNDPTKDIVMVSVNGMKSLKKAYPNYFLDAKDFVNTIKLLITKMT